MPRDNLENVPKWLQDLTEKDKTKNSYKIMDLTQMQRDANVLGRNSNADYTTLEKKYTRQSSARYGRRSSLAAEVYERNQPQSINVNPADYLVPELEGNITYATLMHDLEQSDLQQSWQNLHTFQQTRKKRCDGWSDQTNLS